MRFNAPLSSVLPSAFNPVIFSWKIEWLRDDFSFMDVLAVFLFSLARLRTKSTSEIYVTSISWSLNLFWFVIIWAYSFDGSNRSLTVSMCISKQLIISLMFCQSWSLYFYRVSNIILTERGTKPMRSGV
jgi:hypothetical protein